MRIEFLRKALPVPDGCCGVEFPNESEELEKELVRALEESTGRRWINTLSVFEELGGKGRLFVYHFPRNLRRAEKLGVKKFPALFVDGKLAVEGEAGRREIERALEARKV